jgi:hypothetical protein
MELFIRIKDGQPFEHPIFGDNFRQAFPDISTDNLPPEFAPFERIEQPVLGAYEVYEGVTYDWVGGIVKDVHHVRQMTTEEKTKKQQATKDAWAAGPNYASWTFDEDRCAYLSPTPYPEDDKPYIWNEESTSWVEVNHGDQ